MGIRWAIELKGCPGEYVGSCGFELWHRPWRYAEIGYELAPEHWGRGIMPQALRVMIRYGIESMHLHRVEAQVSPENIASQRVLAKVGFKREGFLRERGFWNLAHHDLLLFALLASELI
jgi:ribosomal-protein-alanine N-acetyltransferase